MRGDGFVYSRGSRWWVRYSKDGVDYREPCGKDVTTKTDARAVLRRVHQEINRGTYLTPVQRQLKIDDVLDDLVVYLKNKGAASVRKVVSHLKAVRSALGHVRAADLNTVAVE